MTQFLSLPIPGRADYVHALADLLGAKLPDNAGEDSVSFLHCLRSAASGPHSITHSGHEFVFCVRGELDYQVERENFHLTPGDSLLFAAHLKHKWKNPGRNVTNALIVLSDFAEGEQLHAMHWKKSE